MPPQTRFHRLLPPTWVSATAIASVVGAVIWTYYGKGNDDNVDEEEVRPNEGSSGGHSAPSTSVSVINSTKTQVASRRGAKPSLTLAALKLPPPWLISQLSDHYTVHLVFPSLVRFHVPSSYSESIKSTSVSFDSRRVLFHETGEGLVHIARTIGGIFVLAMAGLEGDDFPLETGNEAKAESEVGAKSEPVPLERLLKEIKTFVRSSLVVCPDSFGQQELANLNAISGNGVVIRNWEGLASLLCT